MSVAGPPSDTTAADYLGTPTPMPTRPAPSPPFASSPAPAAKDGASASVAQRIAPPKPPPAVAQQDQGDVTRSAEQLSAKPHQPWSCKEALHREGRQANYEVVPVVHGGVDFL